MSYVAAKATTHLMTHAGQEETKELFEADIRAGRS